MTYGNTGRTGAVRKWTWLPSAARQTRGLGSRLGGQPPARVRTNFAAPSETSTSQIVGIRPGPLLQAERARSPRPLSCHRTNSNRK
jgi:hypothetical protein